MAALMVMAIMNESNMSSSGDNHNNNNQNGTDDATNTNERRVCYWKAKSLKQHIPTVRGKGTIHPAPPYLINDDKVREWRNMTKEEQHLHWESYRKLSAREKREIGKKVPGKKPEKGAYVYHPPKPKARVTRSTTTSGQASLRPRGRPRGSRNRNTSSSTRNNTSSSTRNDTSTNSNPPPSSNNTETPREVVNNRVERQAKSNRRRKTGEKATTDTQKNDVCVQNNFHATSVAVSKLAQSIADKEMTTEYDSQKDHDCAVVLVYINKIKPTKKTGARYTKSEGGLKQDKPTVHLMASSKHVLRICSEAILAGHEHVNHPEITSSESIDRWTPQEFKYSYPEQDTQNDNHMMDKASEQQKLWSNSRNGVSRSIRTRQQTNSQRVEAIARPLLPELE